MHSVTESMWSRFDWNLVALRTDDAVMELVLRQHGRPARRRLLADLERPRHALAHLGPNWYASVMGTGIVANAAALLPKQSAVLHAAAVGIWLLAAVLLAAVTAATALHWRHYPANARSHALDPAMAPFYGAPPMAFLTVGAGTMLVGRGLIGLDAALGVDAVLWTIGTLTGLAASVAVPYLMFTRHELDASQASASWLMPVVPPMVSAATGAALVGHLPAGQARLTLLLACYSMFGLSLLASLVLVTLVWARLLFHEIGPARMVPTVWIVLGPLGQSITAASLLGAAAQGTIPAPYSTAMRAMGVVYGLPVWGFALLWLSLAVAITAHTARRHLPFALTWWSFTFPVGTVVTGTSELAVHTHAEFLAWAAVGLFGLLIVAWITAAVPTARGVFRGSLFLPAAGAPASVEPVPESARGRARGGATVADRAQLTGEVEVAHRERTQRPTRLVVFDGQL
jgi:C4-dicarboxylate transporter/malic acid transport protein